MVLSCNGYRHCLDSALQFAIHSEMAVLDIHHYTVPQYTPVHFFSLSHSYAIQPSSGSVIRLNSLSVCPQISSTIPLSRKPANNFCTMGDELSPSHPTEYTPLPIPPFVPRATSTPFPSGTVGSEPLRSFTGGYLALVAKYKCLSPDSSIGTHIQRPARYMYALITTPTKPGIRLASEVSTVPG